MSCWGTPVARPVLRQPVHEPGRAARRSHAGGAARLLKALERYDPDHGSTFTGFAVPTMLGELKRHFRDTTWAVRVPRRASDLLVTVGTAIESLSQSLGRTPSVAEVAGYLHVTEDDVLAAMEAGAAYRSQPLAAPTDEPSANDDRRTPSAEDAGLDAARLDCAWRSTSCPPTISVWCTSGSTKG